MITKIQSYTDVITNSSSTVFIMQEENAKFYEKDTPYGCCGIRLIDEQWVRDHPYEWTAIFDCLNIPYSEISIKLEIENPPSWYEERDFYEDPQPEDWSTWVDNNLERLKNDLFGLYWVEIEDHFEDAWEYINQAKTKSLSHEGRH